MDEKSGKSTSILSIMPGTPSSALGIHHHNTGKSTSYSFISFAICTLKLTRTNLLAMVKSLLFKGFSSFASRILQWLRRIHIILSPSISCWGNLVSNFVFEVLLRVCSLGGQGSRGYGTHINKYLPTLHLFP